MPEVMNVEAVASSTTTFPRAPAALRRASAQVQRTEHERLVTGAGEYVADHSPAGYLHLGVVRSSIASGTIRSLDTNPALAVDGVVAAFTAADFAGEVPFIPMRIVPVEAMQQCLQPVLAINRVRYVGEPVAIVVAESPAAAEDGLEAVSVEYDDCEPRLGYMGSGRPVWDELHDDEYCVFDLEKGNADAAFARADVVVKEQFSVQRHTSLPLETRGVAAEWEGSTLNLWGPTKYLRFTRQVVADALGVEEHQVVCHHIDVGGGFGARGEVYPEDVLVPWAARRVGQPVRWIEDRREHLLTINHSREHSCRFEIAAAADGRLLAFRYTDVIDMGAYARPVGGRVAMIAAEAMPGPYIWEAFKGRTIAHASNKTPSGTMRGPSGFEVNFIRERALDMIARQLEIDPAELRRRNLIPPHQMPFEVTLGPTMEPLILDTGDYERILTEFLDEIGYESLKAEVRKRRELGEIVGVGLGAFLDHSGLGKTESALIEIDDSGRIVLGTTGSEIGQGIASMMQRVVAPIFGLSTSDIDVVTNDTAYHDEGLGTYASRSTVFVGSALYNGALRLKAEVSERVAEALSCDASDVSFSSEGATSGGRTIPWPALGPRRVIAGHDAPEPTFGFGCHVAVARIDADTGLAVPERVAVAYDCGRAIDRAGVTGQLAGGTVQGLGGALLEELAYDEHGQPQATSLADYMIPTAMDVPVVDVYIVEDQTVPTNPLGVKGAGEAGILGIGAAMANAVADAVVGAGAADGVVSLPLKPDTVADLLGWTREFESGRDSSVSPAPHRSLDPPRKARIVVGTSAAMVAVLSFVWLWRRRHR